MKTKLLKKVRRRFAIYKLPVEVENSYAFIKNKFPEFGLKNYTGLQPEDLYSKYIDACRWHLYDEVYLAIDKKWPFESMVDYNENYISGYSFEKSEHAALVFLENRIRAVYKERFPNSRHQKRIDNLGNVAQVWP